MTVPRPPRVNGGARVATLPQLVINVVGAGLWLTGVRTPEVELLARAGLAGRVHVEPRIDAALERLSRS